MSHSNPKRHCPPWDSICHRGREGCGNTWDQAKKKGCCSNRGMSRRWLDNKHRSNPTRCRQGPGGKCRRSIPNRHHRRWGSNCHPDEHSLNEHHTQKNQSTCDRRASLRSLCQRFDFHESEHQRPDCPFPGAGESTRSKEQTSWYRKSFCLLAVRRSEGLFDWLVVNFVSFISSTQNSIDDKRRVDIDRWIMRSCILAPDQSGHLVVKPGSSMHACDDAFCPQKNVTDRLFSAGFCAQA